MNNWILDVSTAYIQLSSSSVLYCLSYTADDDSWIYVVETYSFKINNKYTRKAGQKARIYNFLGEGGFCHVSKKIKSSPYSRYYHGITPKRATSSGIRAMVLRRNV